MLSYIVENLSSNYTLIIKDNMRLKNIKSKPFGDHLTQVAALLILSKTRVGFHFPSSSTQT